MSERVPDEGAHVTQQHDQAWASAVASSRGLIIEQAYALQLASSVAPILEQLAKITIELTADDDMYEFRRLLVEEGRRA
jgi:hypothetical protein